jgi:hypothetical protein
MEASTLGERGLCWSLELIRGVLVVARDVIQGGTVLQSAEVAIAVQQM